MAVTKLDREIMILETDVLIKRLSVIDGMLSNRTAREERSFIDRFGTKVKLYDIDVPVFNSSEIMGMYNEKTRIIMELHKRKIISGGEYGKYMLSEDPAFIPELTLTKGSYTKEK